MDFTTEAVRAFWSSKGAKMNMDIFDPGLLEMNPHLYAKLPKTEFLSCNEGAF